MDRSPVSGAARLAAILDSLPEALLVVDGGGRVVNANAVALGWFEMGGSPLVGRPVTEFLSGYGTALARVGDGSGGMWSDGGGPDGSAAGSGTAAGAGKAGSPERMVAKTVSGEAFPAELLRSTLPQAHGGLELLVLRDVSGIADAEQELKRQQRQTELILRAASEGIVGVDTAGRIVLVNPAAARILGYRASELGGREFHTLSSTGGNPVGSTDSPVLDTLRTGRKHRLGAESETVLHSKDGTIVPIELSTAPVLEGESLVGAVVTFVDLSRFRVPALRTAAEVEREAGGPGGHANGSGGAGSSRSQTQSPNGGPADGAVPGGVGAESVSALRRPLDAARTELARLGDSADAVGLSPSARHHLAHISAELAEAARLVDDLLDAATGLSGLRKRPAELGRIVHAAVDAATDLAAAAHIDLAVHTGPAEVVIDADRMTQAVRHLLVDTIQASPSGSTVVVAAARRGTTARIEIRGIDIGSVPEHLGFARVVVERHDGSVSVHRVEGKGVTYVIEIPAGSMQVEGSAPSGALGRGAFVDETRIIPMVRELATGSPGADVAAPGTVAASAAPAPVVSAADVSGFGAASAGAGAGTSAASGRRRSGVQPPAHVPAQTPSVPPAMAAMPTIPRQAAPVDETSPPFATEITTTFDVPQNWYEDDERYGATQASAGTPAPAPQAMAIADAGAGGPATSQTADGAIAPRGRRRAAAQQQGAVQPEAQAQQTFSQQSADEDQSLVGGLSYRPVDAYQDADPRDEYLIQHVSEFPPITGGSGPGSSQLGAGTGTGPGVGAGVGAGSYGDSIYPTPPQAQSQPLSQLGGYGDESGPYGDASQQSGIYGAFGATDPSAQGDVYPTAQPGGYGTAQQSDVYGAPTQNDAYGVQQQSDVYGAQLPTASPIPDATTPRAWPNPDEPDYPPTPAPPVPAPTTPAQRKSGSYGSDFSWGSATTAAPEPTPSPTLLVWPAPEQAASELLVAQGYAPAALKTPNQLSEQGPLKPVALLADPVGVPVTRAALHTLRAAAADSGIPLFVTAGLGAVPAAALAATARRGADPSALLRALTPEQVSAPRVLLVEENADISAAFATSLERDGMRVTQSPNEADAVTVLATEHPHLVVMNLTLIRRRRSGVVDWLRAYERLHLAPTVLYTIQGTMPQDAALIDALRSGAAAIHLTDREVGYEPANRLLDLMGKVAD